MFLIATLAALVATAAPRDTTLPAFHATAILVDGDSVWFVGDPIEDSELRPAVIYVRSSRTWLLVMRTSRTLPSVERDGATDAGTWSATLPNGYELAAGAAVTDPRYAGRPDWYDHRIYPALLHGPTGREFPVLLSHDSAAAGSVARKAAYAAAGGDARRATPPFSSFPSHWAAGGRYFAFAFPAASPPTPDVPWRGLDDREQRYDLFLSGFVLFDTASKKSTSVVAPSLIERAWAGVALGRDALWALPVKIAVPNDRYSDAPSRSAAPALARYDLTRRTWRFVDPHDVPIGELSTIAAGDEELYLIGADGIAVLDAPTMRWSARYCMSSTYRLPDGADTAVTHFVAARPVVRERAADDTTRVLEAIADELNPRHRTDFIRALRRYAPFDTLQGIAADMEGQRGGRWDTGDFFVLEADANTVSSLLARPEFVLFLREAMWKEPTQGFAIRTMQAFTDPLPALRVALDSGTFRAALDAANALVVRRDSSGLVWLRRQLSPSSKAARLEELPSIIGMLAKLRDTASVSRALALLEDPPRGLPRDEQASVAEALRDFEDAGARRRITAALAARPWLPQPGFPQQAPR